MLGRVESPGFQHTAVMLGCVELSEAEPVANNYRNTAHTRRHIPIGGSVAGEGGVAHRSTQQFYWAAWSRAARDGFCGRGCDVLVSMFPRSEILIERESKAEFVLGRVESPGFQHTAVMLGCVEPSEAAPVANNYRNTAHTRRHIPIGGSVAGEGGVAHRSTQQFYWVAWSRAARDGFCGRGCDVLVSMFPRSNTYREEKKSEAQLVANTYCNMTIEG